jgi:cytochrome c553
MTMLRVLAVAGSLAIVAGMRPAAAPQQPAWAYGFTAPPTPQDPPAPAAGSQTPAPEDITQHKLPGSSMSFTRAQIRDQFGPADWFPGDHPAMPEIVSKGSRDRQVVACSLCHYPNGKGRPENAGVSGLPHDYFVQAMRDFRNGKRKSSDPRKSNTNRMIGFAKAMTDDEIEASATYFASIAWTPWIRVVETDTVPTTRIAGGMFLPREGTDAGKEPIGQRIIETPENPMETEILRNPRSGFVAYVPSGSIRKGESITRTGQCALCHGADMAGLGPVPGLAGRSPSYLVRQLYDMQQGTRAGVWTDLMKPVVDKLTADDLLNVAAYLASLKPRPVPSRP